MKVLCLTLSFVVALLFVSPLVPAQENIRLYHVVDITQGENGSVMAGVRAGQAAEVPIAISLGCCRADAPKTVKVEAGKENLFVIRIHAPLKQEPGYYSLVVAAGDASESIVVNVKTSDLVERLSGLERYAESLYALAKAYEEGGMPMGGVKAALDVVSERLSKAREAVDDDDSTVLYESLFFAEGKLYYEIPLMINSVKSATSIRNLIWIPIIVFVIGASLVLLRIKA